VGKRVEDANTYRIGHPLAPRIIDKCKAVTADPGEVVFRYKDSGKKIAVVESLIGQSGWLLCNRLTISAFETEDHLLFAGLTDSGVPIYPTQACRLFDLPGEVIGIASVPDGVHGKLTEQINTQQQVIAESLSRKNGTWFDVEMDKLDRWAEDRRKSLKAALDEMDTKIRETRKDARLAPNLPTKLDLQRQLRQLEAKRNDAWKEFDEASREVDRQKDVLLDDIGRRLHNALKSPDTISAPAFLSEAKATKGLQKNISVAKKRVEVMKNRITRLFVKPTVHDPVYKVVQRMFTDKTPFNLTRENKIRFAIRRLAFKRFILGYPPRKKSDTSIGDAINWEWIVKCAAQGSYNVIVVSRDSDYGVTFGKEAYINDWLRQEFRARISKKRQITLTARLAEALERVQVRVSAEEEKVEEELVEASQEKRGYGSVAFAEWMKHLEENLKEIERQPRTAPQSK